MFYLITKVVCSKGDYTYRRGIGLRRSEKALSPYSMHESPELKRSARRFFRSCCLDVKLYWPSQFWAEKCGHSLTIKLYTHFLCFGIRCYVIIEKVNPMKRRPIKKPLTRLIPCPKNFISRNRVRTPSSHKSFERGDPPKRQKSRFAYPFIISGGYIM